MSDCKLNETPIGTNCQTHDVIFAKSVAECPYATIAALTTELDALMAAAQAVIKAGGDDRGELHALAALLPNTGDE